MSRPSRRDALYKFFTEFAQQTDGEINWGFTHPPFHKLFEVLNINNPRVKKTYEELIPEVLNQLVEDNILTYRTDHRTRRIYQMVEHGELKVAEPGLFAANALATIVRYTEIEHDDPAAAAVRTRMMRFLFEDNEAEMIALIRSVESRLIALKRLVEYADLIREIADNMLSDDDIAAIKRYIKYNYDPEAYF